MFICLKKGETISSLLMLDNYLSFSRASTRSRNSKKIWKPFSRLTNILKFSFWHRYIDKWNSLPDSLIYADLKRA